MAGHGSEPNVRSAPAPQDHLAHRVGAVDYELLFEHMLDGFALHEMIFDGAGLPVDYRFLAINPAFEQLVGLAAAEVIGRTVREALPTTEPFWIQTYGQVVTSGEVARFEHRAPDLGKDFEVVAFRPQPGRFACVFRDITEQLQAEAAVRALNAQLDQRVQERTAELAAANRELEAFAYSVSHDLRAPLRSLDGFSAVLCEEHADRLDDEALHCLDRIRAATQRMGSLIDDMLTLSRVSRADMAMAPLDLSAIAQRVASELQATAPGRSVSWRIGPGLVAHGDARLLESVLANLLGNAWKFTSLRSEACVEFAAEDVAGETVYSVRDDGAGFDMAYAGKLFGAFQRLHSAVEFEGTGVGLATVQRIVHRHGGRVWAEGAVGHGATVYFTLGPGE